MDLYRVLKLFPLDDDPDAQAASLSKSLTHRSHPTSHKNLTVESIPS